jgi:hypothetical protein
MISWTHHQHEDALLLCQ